jgi:hypothetical protein
MAIMRLLALIALVVQAEAGKLSGLPSGQCGRFIVVSQQRSGSGYVVRGLDAHPELSISYHEPFRRDPRGCQIPRELRFDAGALSTAFRRASR